MNDVELLETLPSVAVAVPAAFGCSTVKLCVNVVMLETDSVPARNPDDALKRTDIDPGTVICTCAYPYRTVVELVSETCTASVIEEPAYEFSEPSSMMTPEYKPILNSPELSVLDPLNEKSNDVSHGSASVADTVNTAVPLLALLFKDLE